MVSHLDLASPGDGPRPPYEKDDVALRIHVARERIQKLLAQHLKTVGVAGEAVENATAASDEERQLVAQLRQMIKDGVTDDCSVCLEYLKSPVITPCAHVFCKTCIETVLDTVVPPSCPLCRRTPISTPSRMYCRAEGSPFHLPRSRARSRLPCVPKSAVAPRRRRL